MENDGILRIGESRARSRIVEAFASCLQGSIRKTAAMVMVCTILLGARPIAASGAESLTLRWQWADPVSDYRSDLAVLDFDGDGRLEILVRGCDNRCWILLRKGGNGYVQLASSPETVNFIQWLSVSEGAGGPASVITHSNGGRVEIGRFENGAVVTRSVAISAWDPEDALAADLDGDGATELIVIDSEDLYVHDFSTGALLETRFGLGGSDLSIGQTDLDLQLEIAVATPTGSCWILDGLSFDIEWGAPSGCGAKIELTQILPDAPMELLTSVAASPFSRPRVFDPPMTAPLWTADNTCCYSYEMVVADISSEPGLEILVSSAFGSIQLLSGTTGEIVETWKEHGGVGPFAAGDVDSDGALELVLTNGRITTSNPLVVVDAATEVSEYLHPRFAISWGMPAAGDLDADGDLELAVGGAEFGTSMKATVLSFDGSTGSGPASRHVGVAEYGGATEAENVVLFDIDSAPGLDLCTAYSSSSWYLACMPAARGDEYWRLQTGSRAAPLINTDLGFDGTQELVAGRRPGGNTNVVASYRSDLGWLQWQSPNLNPELRGTDHLCHGDFGGLAGERLVAIGGTPLAFQLLDPLSGLVVGGAAPDPVPTFIICANLDDDDPVELLGARYDGVMAALNPEDGSWSTPVAGLGEPIYALATADFLGLGTHQVAALTSDRILIIDLADGSVLVALDKPLGAWAEVHSFQAIDLDGDTRHEIVFRSRHKLTVIGLPDVGTGLLLDGFESGSPTFWSYSPI